MHLKHEDDRIVNPEVASALIESLSKLLEEDMAIPVAAGTVLVQLIINSKASTWMELELELSGAISVLKSCSPKILGGRTPLSLISGCDLFMKYITRAFSIDCAEFSDCVRELTRRGELFAHMSLSSRAYIAELGHSFIQENSTVLVHGSSRVVQSLILRAAQLAQFSVIVTEARPSSIDEEQLALFREAGLTVNVIPDAAVAAVMERVDICLVGAEAVMENGGIINKLGSFQVGLVAKAMNKPFYVGVESYKFARFYPLNQRDALNYCGNCSLLEAPLHGGVDFTPAEYITLLFTDLGVLTPAAVSDELIKLYR